MNMRNTLTLIGFLLFSVSLSAQTMESAADNDPAAKKILDKLKSEYDTYTSMEVDFNLVMELPGQDAEEQKGKVIQQGEKYSLDVGDRALVSDGTSVWVHIKKNNEVQINDAEMDEEGAGMLSPKDMLKLYESGDYIYAIVDEPLLDGEKMVQIDFKPLDRNNEFSKMSLFVKKSSKEMAQMKVFSKDGGRYTLKISDITANKEYDPATFVFDESKYPGIYIEDLRID